MRTNKNSTLAYGLLVCSMAGIFYAYEFLLRILPGALQTELMEAYGHLSAGKFGQLSALYYFAYSPMQLPVGLLMDRYGPRRILTFSCLACAIGSWMFLQTDNLAIVGFGRFLVGFGSSFAFVGMLFLGHHWLPRRFFSLFAGLVTTFAMLTLMFGVVKITALAANVGLSTILYSLVWFGFILSFFIFWLVKDNPNNELPTHQQPWSEFFREVLQVLMKPKIWLIGFIGATLYTALSVFGELWGKIYLEQAHQLTSMQAAQGVSAIFFGWAIGAPLVGYLSDHTGQRIFPLLLGAVLGLISISIVLYIPGLSFWSVTFLLFLYGVFTASEIIVFVMGKEICEGRLAGTVFASVNMIVMLGGMIFQPMVGYLLDWSAGPQQFAHVYTVEDYRLALSVLPFSLVFVIGLLGVFKWMGARR